METVLVIGATGQLGTAAIKRLQSRPVKLRALVRTAQSASRFQALGVEAVLGDLTDPASLERACVQGNVI